MAGNKEITRPEAGAALQGRIEGYQSFLDELLRDRGLWFIIYFAVVLAYLLLNQGGSIDLAKAPQWAFRAFIFGGLAIFCILDYSTIRSKFALVNLRAVLPISLVLLLIDANIVTIRRSETIEEAMNFLAYAAMAFLCYTYIDSLKRLRQFVELVLVFGFLIAFYGLFIFYGALWSRGEMIPLSYPFYWHNPCAGFLLLIWPTMLAQFYSLRRGWHTFLILYIFYITFTGFVLTLSRAGWLAAMIPFFWIPFVLSRRKIMVSWRPAVLLVLYFLSALPFVLRHRGHFFQPIIDRINQIRWDDYSVVGRMEFWSIAWRVFLKHPWFGIGFNTFGYYYVHYQTNPFYYSKDVHNLYLRFMVEGGVIGLAVILSILAIVFSLVRRTLREGPHKMLTVYRVGLLAGIMGELLHLAFDFDETFPVIPMLLLCQMAIVARTFTYSRAEQDQTIDQWEPVSAGKTNVVKEAPGKTVRRGWFIRPVIVWLVLALIFFGVNIFGFRSMQLYETGKGMIDNQAQLAEERTEEKMSQLERERVMSLTQETPTFSQVHSEVRSEIVQEGMKYWQKSLNFNPWNWYALKDLLTAHYYGAMDLAKSGTPIDLDRIINPGLGYGYRLLKVTPYRPASYYYVGQLEILAGRLRGDNALKEKGIAKLLHSIKLDPKNIPTYYLGIAQYYADEGNNDEALKYLAILEEKFVPLDDAGQIDFRGLKEKSRARQDWIEITETMRQGWWLKADILIKSGEKAEALIPLYNGFNTPVGGGEMAEQYYNLGRLQFPFLLKIAEISSELGDWVTVSIRAKQAIDILKTEDLLGTPESRQAHDFFYEAQKHLDAGESQTGESVPGTESPEQPPS